jgi:hypothetical protein
MFSHAILFNSRIISKNWSGFENVTNMSYMFMGAVSFNADLRNWRVDNVHNMSHMFAGANSFNGRIGEWDVSNVTDMSFMFAGASSFTEDIRHWDVDGVHTWENMFENCPIPEDNKPPLFRQPSHRERLEQFNAMIERQRQEISPTLQETSDFPECGICYDLLNNIDGPGPSTACETNCNDAIKVCVNNHIFHRGCVLTNCNVSSINISSQMNNNAPEYAHMRLLANRMKCPLCREDIMDVSMHSVSSQGCDALKDTTSFPKMSEDALHDYHHKGGKRHDRKKRKVKSKTKRKKSHKCTKPKNTKTKRRLKK